MESEVESKHANTSQTCTPFKISENRQVRKENYSEILNSQE
jgi:hypothetical protein